MFTDLIKCHFLTLYRTKTNIYIRERIKQFMKIKNAIHEALLNRGKILSKKQIEDTILEYDKKIKKVKIENLIKYLSRHRYIKRIFSGYYYINSYDERNRNYSEIESREAIFIVLNKLGIRWYAGLTSALYIQGKIWQTPNILAIPNDKFSGLKKILGINVKFMKIKKELIFGLKKTKINNTEYFYSDPAKTYMDMVYFKQIDSLKRIKNTDKYLKKYPKWVGKK